MLDSRDNSTPLGQRLSVEEVVPRPKPKVVQMLPPPNPVAEQAPSPPPEKPTLSPSHLELVVKTIAAAFAVRALLLLALLGAFVLALRAMSEQTPMSLGVLVIYCVFAVGPVAYLEVRRHSA